MKEDSVLSFKWQSFPTHMVGSLDTCYEKQQFVDLSLACKDGTILKCHKMVLANSSSFFRRLLLANDHPHPMIVLHDIEADDLKTLVNFMYCGEIQVVQSEVRRLLKLAETLEVTGLRHLPPSLLSEGSNNEYYDALKKTTTVSRLKLEEAKNSPVKSNVSSEHETSTKTQGRTTPQTRFAPKTNPYKTTAKVPQETPKNEEINISELCQRLETSNSGISIIDINEPSTSKGVRRMSPMQRKRKDFPTYPEISWPSVLSTITNKPLSFQKVRCIMDEVEITAGKPSTSVSDNKINEPLDRRKVKKNSSEDNNLNTVYIKDEIDISSDMEEDVDMDPLEVDEIDNENLESNKTMQQLYSQILVQSINKSAHYKDLPPRKDSNKQTNDIVNKLNPDRHVTEEEFQNFMHRVTEVEKIVKKLASFDQQEQECGKKLADEMLKQGVKKEIYGDGEIKVKTDRSIINKYPSKEHDSNNDPNQMSREIFMKSVENDAKKRAEERKIRNERAETLKRIANGAFKEGDYEKAVTYYSKALEQRKDSAVLWNNRALSYVNLGLFEKALHDCEWTLKLNASNLKALLNSAKCYMHLRNREKSKECIQIAKEKNPHFNKFIDEFQENIELQFNKSNVQIINDEI
ncbi:Tetratricopeptide repeat protein 12 [Trachymyrmex zeteki]|uniref:Tetratricopeptide repeat protein 12 n=1 Tax=Mycetomoellerius zeteki TaxID=64791 RepID=A0A151WZ62_9HYME|nr:Tetratricopeptide repeat protein 12 [Trachymyrmex zeteki]